MGAERWDEQVGSVADEAGRLLESLRRTAAESAAPEPAADDDTPDAAGSPPAATHDPSCTWCPLCRGAAVVRSLSPETLAKLADLAALAASVLTDLASGRAGGGPPASGPDHPAAARPTAPTARPEHRPRTPRPAQSRPIPVTDADDPKEAPRG